MLYYVIAADGSRYGPADIETLNGWIQEGRISPSMLLEEESSGARITASAVPGLVFQQQPQQAAAAAPSNGPPSPGGQPNPVPSGNPYSQSSQRPTTTTQYASSDTGGTETVLSWILFAVGLVGCCCVGLGVVPSGIGIWLANTGRKKGNSSATASMVLNIIVCVLCALMAIRCLTAWPQVKEQFQQAMHQQEQMQQQQRLQRQPGFTPPPSNQ